MKNEKDAKPDNPAELSAEDLLRFLAAIPEIWQERESLSSAAAASPEICPGPEWHLHLALDELEAEKAEELKAHSVACPACGERLSMSRMALEGNPSIEETAAIAELAAARPEWQRRMARDLAATPRRGRPILPFRLIPGPRWLAAGAAAALAILAGGLLWQRQLATPERQLARAYEESRTLELRVPDASFTAYRPGGHARGGAGDAEPAPLLDARAKLARELERSPKDGHWLELRARADVLEQRYDSAIELLERLMVDGPVTAELLTDTASAYYQRGLATGSQVDRSTALDELARADKLAPTDPVVLFNEAIVMEDRGQMMNAVEVWNRYITVERDAKWREEGKRKLAALEQTLNRLRTHASRVRRMLATPAAMDALAGNAKTLAALDEELSEYELDRLILAAFPEQEAAKPGSQSSSERARGSPCPASCVSSRGLLQAIGKSLEIEHRDFWLADLLPIQMDALTPAAAASYARGLRLLGQAMRNDVSDLPAEGARLASQAEASFREVQPSGPNREKLRAAVHVGQRRAAVESMFALQLQANFDACRTLGQRLRAEPQAEWDDARYPWIAGQERVTEKVCDDTPQTRGAGRALAAAALDTALSKRYRLLTARVRLRFANEASVAGDEETAEAYILGSLEDLYSGDSPAARVFPAIGTMGLVESQSNRSRAGESYLRETLRWAELGGFHGPAAQTRTILAEAQIKDGDWIGAEEQLRIAYAEGSPSSLGAPEGANFGAGEENLASAMLERGDLLSAAGYLDRAKNSLAHSSDIFLSRVDAVNRAQLALALGRADQSASLLESAIRLSEGSDVRRADRVDWAELGEQDHDAYAELAASWLAQGRPAESVLALWERFRLRSRGIPIAQCQGGALDCELPRLEAERRRLGGSILIGQILLLDRVLMYRMDSNGVRWSAKRIPRQTTLEAAQALELAVSSPRTSTETAARLGAGLASELLPELPPALPDNSSLLLEPDPNLANLCWPVLPAKIGPLGIAYPLAELRSILAPAAGRGGLLAASDRALVVGASFAGEGEPPLPEAMSEATHVDELLHAKQILLGERATAARVGAHLGSATIFHFAGHALQTRDGTELLLAAESPSDKTPWVDGKFLRQHPPRACRLAVLSACSTGTRQVAWSHPLENMVEAFASLGVPEVVATRWQIDSQASVPLIDAFYGGLANGDTPAMAMTSARRVQFGSSNYRNPYYWGAYYVTGREIDRPTGELHARR